MVLCHFSFPWGIPYRAPTCRSYKVQVGTVHALARLPVGLGFGWLWLGFGWLWLALAFGLLSRFRLDFGLILGLGWLWLGLWLDLTSGFHLLRFCFDLA